MKVFLTGATGVIGRPLVRMLAQRGHEVIGLARTGEGAAIVERLGGRPARADVFDAQALARAAEGADVVVRLATRLPPAPHANGWEENDRLRREGARALLAAATEAGARLYVQESVVWVARPDDGAPFDERTTPNPDDLTRSALDAEVLAAQACARTGLAVATLRLGWTYAASAPHTRRMAEDLKRWRLPLIAGGRSPLSFVHVHDAAAAFVAAIEAQRGGLWHVVDDRPAPTRAFFGHLAHGVGAPAPLSVPEFVARWLAGEEAVRFLATPMVTSNARFKSATAWRPQYPTYQEGLAQVASEWKSELR